MEQAKFDIVKSAIQISRAGEVLVPLHDTPMKGADEFSDFFSTGMNNASGNARTLLASMGASSAAMREIVANPDKVYRVVEGGVTTIEGTDLVHGAIWRSGTDGKGLKEMTKFAEVGQTAKIASTFVSQGMLIYIACELNDIKKGISEIQNELFESEVSHMKGCIRFAGTALRHYRKHHEKGLLFNAIQSLETAVDPLLDAIMRQVRRTPANTSFLGTSKKELKGYYDEALSAVICLLKGMIALSILYSVVDPDFGKEELSNLLASFLGNKDMVVWLHKAGIALAQNGYGEKYREIVEKMEKSLKLQRQLLVVPNVGLMLTGKQIADLQLSMADECSLQNNERAQELVRA